MPQNLQLDPMAKDYVVVNGSPIPSDSVLDAAYYALNIPQGKWMYGQTGQGSQLYSLENIKRSANIEQLYASYANDAITRNLINNGLATAVNTYNTQATRSGTVNNTQVVPNTTQLSNQLNFVPTG